MTEREIHPVAAQFPMLPADELRALADDIKTRGLLNPITTDRDGRILDGRNRLTACKLAGIPPSFTIYAGDDPDGYALAVNGQRRDLGKGRKAMVAAQSLLVTNSSAAEAARSIGVSQSLVAKAVTVRDHAADLAPKVLAGEMGLDEAYKIARERKAPADPKTELDDWLRREFAAEWPREVPAANELIMRLQRGEPLIKYHDGRASVFTAESAAHPGYWWVFLMVGPYEPDGPADSYAGHGIWNKRPTEPIGVPWMLMHEGVSVRGRWEAWSKRPTDHPFWIGWSS